MSRCESKRDSKISPQVVFVLFEYTSISSTQSILISNLELFCIFDKFLLQGMAFIATITSKF